jgi:hypothetical protein
MAGQYLQNYNDTVKSKQVEQILDKLTKQKESGEIRSLEEFTQKFNELVADLFAVNLTPSLKIEEGDEVISSETHNEMLGNSDNDLTTAAEAVNNLESVQKAHTQIIEQNTILKKIYDQIRELEIKTEVYRGLKYNPYGFDGAIYSNFNGSKSDQLEYNDQTKDLFKDSNSFVHLQIEKNEVGIINEDQTLTLREKDKKTFLFDKATSFASVDWETYIGTVEDEESQNVIFPIENLLKEDNTFYKKEYTSETKTSFKDFTLKGELNMDITEELKIVVDLLKAVSGDTSSTLIIYFLAKYIVPACQALVQTGIIVYGLFKIIGLFNFDGREFKVIHEDKTENK